MRVKQFFALIGYLFTSTLFAASTWDDLLSNSYWYVPVPNLIAYSTFNQNSLTVPPPLATGDQTTWTIGPIVDGVITGTATETLLIGNTIRESTSTMSGTISDSGIIYINFTDTSSGDTLIGFGRIRYINDIPLMEMQVISSNRPRLTHWAYMTPYDPNAFTPPPPNDFISQSITSPEWKWVAGTPWHIVSPYLFNSNKAGNFIVLDYNNGYFWGEGIGPDGQIAQFFTEIGSITPEGNVLFATIEDGTMSALAGEISGNSSNASMYVVNYGFPGVPSTAYAYLTLIPPYVNAVLTAQNTAAIGAANTLYQIAGTRNGLYGPMSSVIQILNDMSGESLSNAISETLPVMAGASSQATANNQRLFNQIIDFRQDDCTLENRTALDQRCSNVWGKVFGTTGTQGEIDHVMGYNLRSGGLILGADHFLTPTINLGAFFIYDASAVSSNIPSVSNTLDITSYLIGTYGKYMIDPNLSWDYQANIGFNLNKGIRHISFYNVNAYSNYDSYSAHLGTGIKKYHSFQKNIVVPSLRIDYLTVQATPYTETHAGVLNLSVDSQSYNELFTTADLKIDHEFAPQSKISAHTGVSYNPFSTQVHLTTDFLGGGAPFITEGLAISHWLYTSGLSLTHEFQENITLKLSYDAQYSTTNFLNQWGSILLKAVV